MATRTKSTNITSIKKGEIYETRSGQLLEVTNGRLQQDGDLGASFTGRTIEFDLQQAAAVPSPTTDRFYLDELVRKLSQQDYDEWLEIGRREAEAIAAAQEASGVSPKTGGSKTPKSTSKRKAVATSAKSPDSMSQLEAAVQVLSETGEPMTTKAMIEAMATQGYWTSPGGATPWATLYSALIREIANKGTESRFTKVDKGQFGLREAAPKTGGRKAKRPA